MNKSHGGKCIETDAVYRRQTTLSWYSELSSRICLSQNRNRYRVPGLNSIRTGIGIERVGTGNLCVMGPMVNLLLTQVLLFSIKIQKRLFCKQIIKKEELASFSTHQYYRKSIFGYNMTSYYWDAFWQFDVYRLCGVSVLVPKGERCGHFSVFFPSARYVFSTSSVSLPPHNDNF